ncbi:MAG: DUF6754 domain-containing protein [bacterium]
MLTDPEIIGRVFMLALCGVVLWQIYCARRKLPPLRKIPGLQVFEEAIGRAAELGRPVYYCPGWGEKLQLSPIQFAAISLITAVARGAARLGLRTFVTIAKPPGFYPMVLEAVREAYVAEGQRDLFSPDDIKFVSEDQSAYAAATVGLIARERPGSCFLLGDYGFESLIVAEAGQRVNAFQISGTPQYHQTPFFVCATDYTLIAEEYFAASAYLSNDPQSIGSLVGQDWIKAAIIATGVIGTIVNTVGVLR